MTRFVEAVDPVDGTRWRADVDFLSSNWACIWDRGCEGIGQEPAAPLGLGCCSVGAELIDEDEAMRVAALGLALDPSRFQQHEAAETHGVFGDDSRANTRIIDGACIFLNRPGFGGGAGCALHLAALDDGEDPIDYKPTICWQMPLRVDVSADGARTLRPWVRSDLSDDPGEIAWCCTQRQPPGTNTAYVGAAAVAESMAAELRGIVGPEVAVELTRRAT